MKVIGKIMLRLEKESKYMKIKHITKVPLVKIYQMEMVFTQLLMEMFSRESSKKAFVKGKVK